MTKCNTDYYYDFRKDVEAYPDAWCYLIVGGRSTGKTYSTLNYMLDIKSIFTFLKRTMDDVDLLCVGSKTDGDYSMDLSPFKSINRDRGTDIRAIKIQHGIGGFYSHIDGNANGLPIGYILALSAVTKFKGFDLSDSEFLIFDEFIPNIYDRVNRKEGEQLLDLYKTVSRDREHRTGKPLKLVCLANATSISNPVMNILEITDTVAQMQSTGLDKMYIEDRGIFIHILADNLEFSEREKQTAIYKAMKGTAWADMSFGNKFAYNDFSNVKRESLKNAIPLFSLKYKQDEYYIYNKLGTYIMTYSRGSVSRTYDLNLENDQKRFYIEELFDLRERCIDGQMKFETYSMYDLIINYKSFFKL